MGQSGGKTGLRAHADEGWNCIFGFAISNLNDKDPSSGIDTDGSALDEHLRKGTQ